MTSSLMNLKPRGCSLLSRSMATTTTSRSGAFQQYPSIHRKASPHSQSRTYTVIFDAGNSRSRVHVFYNDSDLNLVHIVKDLEFFVQTKLGLGACLMEPQKDVESLLLLLDKAENVVPVDLHRKTPVKVGATVGLRALGIDASDRILQVVKNFLKVKSTLKSKPEWVTVLDGMQEGAFQLVTINYLLGNLGRKYSHTVEEGSQCKLGSAFEYRVLNG